MHGRGVEPLRDGTRAAVGPNPPAPIRQAIHVHGVVRELDPRPTAPEIRAGVAGFEPTTRRLTAVSSARLSYTPRTTRPYIRGGAQPVRSSGPGVDSNYCSTVSRIVQHLFQTDTFDLLEAEFYAEPAVRGHRQQTLEAEPAHLPPLQVRDPWLANAEHLRGLTLVPSVTLDTGAQGLHDLGAESALFPETSALSEILSEEFSEFLSTSGRLVWDSPRQRITQISL